MKRTLFAIMAGLSLLSLSASADPGVNIKVDGNKEKVKVVDAGKGDLKGRKVNEFRTDFQSPVSDEWKSYKMEFLAQKSGKVDIHIEGFWASSPEEQEPILIDSIKVNGKLMKNGEFKYTFPHGGKKYPNGFWYIKKAEFVPKGGQNGSPAVKVFYDCPLMFAYKVVENKPYVFEITLKSCDE